MRKTKETPIEYVHGPIVLTLISQDEQASDPKKQDQESEPDDIDKFPDEGEEIENLPPLQPDVDPLERENPDVDDLEDNEPLHDTEETSTDVENMGIEQNTPTGQTIVVDRHIGKDGL